MFSRRIRILLIGAVITLGLFAVILLEAPEPTRTVDEVMEDPSAYLDREIAIRGEIVDGSINSTENEFQLHGSSHTLRIDFMDASVSNGLGDNRTVYAQGILHYIDGEYVLEAQIIKTSCPSKYEEEP